jgi:hypothetical protein
MTVAMQVANDGTPGSWATIESRLRKISPGGSARSARMCAAVRSCTMTAAASGPWPIASPTMSAARPPGSGTMSCQSPPDDAVADRQELLRYFQAGRDLRQPRHQAALQGLRGAPLPVVEPGVVQRQRGARGQFQGQGDLAGAEPGAARRPAEDRAADHRAAGGQRHRQERVARRGLLQVHPGLAGKLLRLHLVGPVEQHRLPGGDRLQPARALR